MTPRRSRPVPWAILLVACVLATMLFGAVPARGAPAAEWQPTGLHEHVTHLFTPASGAFFAWGTSGLWRSDDAGTTWRTVDLPARVDAVAVDLTDHTRLYAGVWVTRDDAMTWAPVGPGADTPDVSVWPLPSPADPTLLYRAVRNDNRVTMYRSNNGGETWKTVLDVSPNNFRPGSSVVTTLFAAHPSDASVLFQAVVGFRGNGNQGTLRRSTDQGETFREVLSSTVRVPRRLVGGRGITPGRFYAALTSEETSSAVFRSDDGGVTWTEASTFGDAGTPIGMGALAYDPTSPDRVWVSLSQRGLKASEDGGRTWVDASPTDWDVNDLALGIDGTNLYASTSTGVFRLPLR
jgi:photosystem II stability/assembly factor-like uncharacterized protein